jgi:hypothetical protein
LKDFASRVYSKIMADAQPTRTAQEHAPVTAVIRLLM